MISLDIKISHLKIAPLVGNLEVGNLEGIRTEGSLLEMSNEGLSWIRIIIINCSNSITHHVIEVQNSDSQQQLQQFVDMGSYPVINHQHLGTP